MAVAVAVPVTMAVHVRVRVRAAAGSRREAGLVERREAVLARRQKVRSVRPRVALRASVRVDLFKWAQVRHIATAATAAATRAGRRDGMVAAEAKRHAGGAAARKVHADDLGAAARAAYVAVSGDRELLVYELDVRRVVLRPGAGCGGRQGVLRKAGQREVAPCNTGRHFTQYQASLRATPGVRLLH
eukprot:96411-Chlamydomonas_euryale.AAC.1